MVHSSRPQGGRYRLGHDGSPSDPLGVWPPRYGVWPGQAGVSLIGGRFVRLPLNSTTSLTLLCPLSQGFSHSDLGHLWLPTVTMQDCSPFNTLRIYVAGHCFRARFFPESRAGCVCVLSVTPTTDSTALGDHSSTNRWFLSARRERVWSWPLIPRLQSTESDVLFFCLVSCSTKRANRRSARGHRRVTNLTTRPTLACCTPRNARGVQLVQACWIRSCLPLGFDAAVVPVCDPFSAMRHLFWRDPREYGRRGSAHPAAALLASCAARGTPRQDRPVRIIGPRGSSSRGGSRSVRIVGKDRP